MASKQKRNRTRLLKKGPGKKISCGRRRQVSPGLPAAPPEAAPSSQQASAAGEQARCGFGATRVGALLGRLRLHVQTDRFLAAHRGDRVWEGACVQAALALADIVARMTEAEMAAPLSPQRTQNRSALETVQYEAGSHPSEGAFRTSGQEEWGTRKTGTATLARCSGELERSVQ